MLPLFHRFPRLQGALPHVPLAQLPTPVAGVPALPKGLDIGGCWIKNDGCSGPLYGGNKVRKLEFLLAHALQQGASTVLTFGAAGSNHALATAIYARALGLECISMLVPQQTSEAVRRNLLYGFQQGAQLHHYQGRSRVALGTLTHFTRLKRQEGRFPQVIPPGGSSPLGCCGFVNAALELKRQVEEGLLPTPDAIYVASGTMGTCVGLLLGLQLAGLHTVVQAIRVTDPPYTSATKAHQLYEATQRFLKSLDPEFPIHDFPQERFCLRDEFLGERYGVSTPEGLEAIALASEATGMKLESTYTGKAFAGLLADARSGILSGKQILFWNTYNAVEFSQELSEVSPLSLPESLRGYFE